MGSLFELIERQRRNLRAWAVVVIMAVFPLAASGQSLVQLRSRFAQEADPVLRAQKMQQLGEAEFAEIARNTKEEKLPDALTILQQYRDEMQSCQQGLDAKGIDAEKHPKGFKQLQFSLRESLRYLDELLLAFSTDEQKPFLEIRNDLERLNTHLIRELFPKGPADSDPSSAN